MDCLAGRYFERQALCRANVVAPGAGEGFSTGGCFEVPLIMHVPATSFRSRGLARGGRRMMHAHVARYGAHAACSGVL
jgi:hypothetical protein